MNSLIKRVHSNFYLVKDLEQTFQFYKKLGLAAEIKDDACRVKLGDFTLAFMDESKAGISNEANQTPKGIGIYTYIEVADVDEYYKAIKADGVSGTEPKTWPWGKREFVVKDPDGYKLVFYKQALVNQ